MNKERESNPHVVISWPNEKIGKRFCIKTSLLNFMNFMKDEFNDNKRNSYGLFS